MMAEIPTGAAETPNYTLWIVSAWLFTTMLSIWGGYRWGFLSRKDSEKLKARIDALTITDSIIADIPGQKTMVPLFIKSGEELKSATFRFSCQLGEDKRTRIEQVFHDYQTLQIKENDFFMTLSSGRESLTRRADSEKVEKERTAMLEALKRLRDEISQAYPVV